MISFIIIGKNIDKTLDLAISSVINFISINRISFSEIIYVDSASIDESVLIAQKYPVKIIQLEGKVNAALGRNEGAKAAKGEILFFIDGDMELLPECYSYFFVSEKKIVYPFLSASYANQFYSEDFEELIKKDCPELKETPDKFQYRKTTGGLFIIEKKYWEKAGGMDTRLCANEDIDFGLQMHSSGLALRFYPNIIMAIHHTVSYYHKKRFSEFIFTARLLCPGVLIRKHFFNRNLMIFFFRARYSAFFLILCLFSAIISTKVSAYLLLIYLFLQGVRSYKIYRVESNFIAILVFKILYDIYSFLGFFFYFPHHISISGK